MGKSNITKRHEHTIDYEGHAELFDNAWDQLCQAVADVRADHPQARIEKIHLFPVAEKRIVWSLNAVERS